jgi:hypothetical protein
VICYIVDGQELKCIIVVWSYTARSFHLSHWRRDEACHDLADLVHEGLRPL